MRNLARFVPFALLAALVAVVPAAVRAQSNSSQPTSSASPPPVLTAFVGPGYDIGLRDQIGDLRGRQIAAGTYQVKVYDYSEIHNFELKGAGVDEETDEEWVGQTTWTVTFAAGGEYEFECDPHHYFMHGRFSASAALAPPPLPAPPPPPPPGGGTLQATVRANATIDLKHPDGSAVTQLQPGSYTIQVDDQTSSHNFHLTGPGVDQSTSVSYAGSTTWSVTLAVGSYSFVCDPHSDFMRGSFTVANGPAPPPPLPPPPPASGPVAAKPGVLIATVRKNYTIDLKLQSGAEAEKLQAGTYTIEVRDQTNEHNFNLTGPGMSKKTTVPWVGTTKWTVALKPGSYRFVCDPHAPLMKGAFTVTAGPPRVTPLRISSLRVSKAGRTLVVRLHVNKRVSARIRLLRRARPVASVGAALKAGSNVKRVRVPARAGRGLYRVQVVVRDAGKRRTFTRSIRF